MGRFRRRYAILANFVSHAVPTMADYMQWLQLLCKQCVADSQDRDVTQRKYLHKSSEDGLNCGSVFSVNHTPKSSSRTFVS